MSGRFTVRGAMVGVALVGLVLGLGRAHVSLGSFAFGVLSIAWVGAARWAEARRAAGACPSLGAVAANFLASAALAVLLLVACLMPAALAWRVVFTWQVFSPLWTHYRPILEPDQWAIFLVLSGGGALGVVRLIRRIGRTRRRGLKPAPIPTQSEGPR